MSRPLKRITAISTIFLLAIGLPILVSLAWQGWKHRKPKPRVPNPISASPAEAADILATLSNNLSHFDGTSAATIASRPKSILSTLTVRIGTSDSLPTTFRDSCAAIRESYLYDEILCRELSIANSQSRYIPDLRNLGVPVISPDEFTRIVPTPGDYDRLWNKYPLTSSYTKATWPVLSQDRATALIYIEVHCGGICAHGDYVEFKKQKNAWKLTSIFPIWMS